MIKSSIFRKKLYFRLASAWIDSNSPENDLENVMNILLEQPIYIQNLNAKTNRIFFPHKY